MTDVFSQVHTAGGADYTTLAAWEAATDIDLVSAEQKHIAACSGILTAVSLYIGGATTNSDFHRVIVATGNAKHDGTSGTGATIKTTNGTDYTMGPDGEDFLHISGMEFNGNNQTFGVGLWICFDSSVASGIVVDSCLLYNGKAEAIRIRGDGTNAIIRNNIVWDHEANGIIVDFDDNNTSFNIENNTVFDCNQNIEDTDAGIRTNQARSNYPSTIHNNVCIDNGDFDMYDDGNTNISLSGNVTSDDSALGSSTTTGISSSDTFKSIDYDTGVNLAPKNSGAAIINVGVAIAGFSHDLSGVSRPQGDSWDAGALEFAFDEEEPPEPPGPQFGLSNNKIVGGSMGKIRF